MTGLRILGILLVVSFGPLLGCASPYDKADADTEGTLPGQCGDGADNDANGLFDCDDPGCQGAPVCDEADADSDSDADGDADADSDSDS